MGFLRRKRLERLQKDVWIASSQELHRLQTKAAGVSNVTLVFHQDVWKIVAAAAELDPATATNTTNSMVRVALSGAGLAKLLHDLRAHDVFGDYGDSSPVMRRVYEGIEQALTEMKPGDGAGTPLDVVIDDKIGSGEA